MMAEPGEYTVTVCSGSKFEVRLIIGRRDP